MQQEQQLLLINKRRKLIMLLNLLLQRLYVRKITLFAGLKRYMKKIGLYLLLCMIGVCAVGVRLFGTMDWINDLVKIIG